MTKPLPHAWTWGAGYHRTRDAECPCGAEVHDIKPSGARTVRYASEPGGELSNKLPPCTRADDEKHDHNQAHSPPAHARGMRG